MKKIGFIIIALLLAGNFVSCSLDEHPRDSIGQEITSLDDAEKVRTGLYSQMKHRSIGQFALLSDYQTDLFHATKGYGQFYVSWFGWNITTTDLDLQRLFYGWYKTINLSNFLIEGIDKLLLNEGLDADEIAELNLYYGEAHWIRAFCYYNLSLYWCKPYTASADTDLGMMIVTRYAPSSVSSTYPARSSLADTFELILDDLTIAEEKIKEPAARNSYYLTVDAVTALQARVALYMGDNGTAATKAAALVNSGRYPLITDQGDFDEYWSEDDSDENIFITNVLSPTDLESSSAEPLDTENGYYLLYNSSQTQATDQPHFVPEKWVIDLYATDDIRLHSYFEYGNLIYPGLDNWDLYKVIKYPGNPDINSRGTSSRWYYLHKGKVFRIAEMYLIAAEAYYNNNNESGANNMLNLLRAARIPSWTTTNYSGTTLRDEIRNERVRELYAEGFRLSDLKRWGLGMTRGAAQDATALFSIYNDISVSASDPRFLWPIPQREVDNNPQVEQNPQ